MRTLAVLRGLISISVMFLGPCILGCGGKVDQAFAPKGRIDKWDTAEWSKVLDKVVTRDGLVRHDLLKSNDAGVRDSLYRYVGLINAAGPKNRPELFPSQDDRLAYYINAYNALCMYAVVQHNFPGNMKTSGIFFLDRFLVGGETMSLDYLEKTYLRPIDPRIHFCINCMSASCPPLRREPYEASRLTAQMNEQGKIFLSDRRGAYREGDKAMISEIFRFFTSDFVDPYVKKTGNKDATILDALQEFAADDSPIRGAKSYAFQTYDWSLNRAR